MCVRLSGCGEVDMRMKICGWEYEAAYANMRGPVQKCGRLGGNMRPHTKLLFLFGFCVLFCIWSSNKGLYYFVSFVLNLIAMNCIILLVCVIIYYDIHCIKLIIPHISICDMH
jgi:hypothetical protein